MSNVNESPLLSWWLRALTEPHGLAIKTDDRQLLRQQLYRARGESNNPLLSEIVLLFPLTPADELWLVKKGARNG